MSFGAKNMIFYKFKYFWKKVKKRLAIWKKEWYNTQAIGWENTAKKSAKSLQKIFWKNFKKGIDK